MTITTVNDIANGLSTSQEIPFLKVGSAPKSIGAFHSLWMAAGQPGAGVAMASGDSFVSTYNLTFTAGG
jgi:hypothetical protein